MIKIRLSNKIEATFSDMRWKCDDKDVQKILNDAFNLDEVTVSDAYRVSEYDNDITGLDAVILDAVAFLKPKIIEYVPDEIPEEVKGVVF